MIDDEWMRIGRRNLSTQRKHAPVPLCPPQIPHDLTWAWIGATVVERRQLTAWAVARPKKVTYQATGLVRHPARTLVTILTHILWLSDTAVRNQYYLASLTILEKWAAGFNRRNLRLPRPTVVCLLHTTRPSLQWFVSASTKPSTDSKGLLRIGAEADAAGMDSANTVTCVNLLWSQYLPLTRYQTFNQPIWTERNM
jgi:hypothetical protein